MKLFWKIADVLFTAIGVIVVMAVGLCIAAGVHIHIELI